MKWFQENITATQLLIAAVALGSLALFVAIQFDIQIALAIWLVMLAIVWIVMRG